MEALLVCRGDAILVFAGALAGMALVFPLVMLMQTTSAGAMGGGIASAIARALGARLARLRVARRLRQSDVAVRAGVSRSTAVLIEKGDPGRTLGQVLRYLDAIAPGATLLALLQESDPALLSLAAGEMSHRVRKLSSDAMEDLDF